MTVYASYGEYYLRRTEFTLVVGQPLHLYIHPPQSWWNRAHLNSNTLYHPPFMVRQDFYSTQPFKGLFELPHFKSLFCNISKLQGVPLN